MGIFLHNVLRYKVLAILAATVLVRLTIYCGGLDLIEDPYCIESREQSRDEQDLILPKKGLVLKIDGMIKGFRLKSTQNIRSYLPSPHSELLLGQLLGIDDLSSVPSFKNAVRSTGTIHVIVVSGYNISLVFTMVVSVLGSQYKRKNLIIALTITLIYSIVAGFDPPVVRAWIMGTMASVSRYYGRVINMYLLLIFSALFMIAISPAFLFSLSFQLSFLATFGLIYYSSFFGSLFKIFQKKNVIIEDLTATLSAQVLVWPLISYYFEQVSIISPVVNALILWTVPLGTVLGGLFLFTTYIPGFIGNLLSEIVSYIVLVPLDFFVKAVYFFDSVFFAVVEFRPSLMFIFGYYILMLIFPRIVLRK